MTGEIRAWTMQLRDGAEAAYDAAHADIWPELVEQMRRDGICRFHLFRSGLTVFAVQERKGAFPRGDTVPSVVTEKWWQAMASLMVTDQKGQPVRTFLDEVFNLDRAAPGTENKHCQV